MEIQKGVEAESQGGGGGGGGGGGWGCYIQEFRKESIDNVALELYFIYVVMGFLFFTALQLHNSSGSDKVNWGLVCLTMCHFSSWGKKVKYTRQDNLDTFPLRLRRHNYSSRKYI